MKQSLKKLLRVFLLATIATSFSGCAALSDKWTIDTVEDTASGNAPVQYEPSIKSYLGNTLKDPFSAQYRNFSVPQKYIEKTHVVTQSPTLVNVNGRATETRKHCWLVTVDVNAKNSYGAYIGWTTHVFLFRGEAIISAHSRSVS
jgi:hypothetical protein